MNAVDLSNHRAAHLAAVSERVQTHLHIKAKPMPRQLVERASRQGRGKGVPRPKKGVEVVNDRGEVYRSAIVASRLCGLADATVNWAILRGRQSAGRLWWHLKNAPADVLARVKPGVVRDIPARVPVKGTL